MKSSRLNILLWGKSLLSMLVLCMAIAVYGQDANAIYNNANAQYKANNFTGAQAAYEKLLAQGYKDATVYYNLANCYYKQAKYGAAILNYERAQRLNPEDEDIAFNLKLANAHVADKIIPVPQLGIVTWWQQFSQSYGAKGWGLWAIAAAWLALMGAMVFLFTGLKKTGATLASIFVVATVALASLAHTRSAVQADSGQAILMVADTYVKSAPDENGTNVFMLHEGVKFNLLDKVGNYSKIRLADGKVGWVEGAYFEKI